MDLMGLVMLNFTLVTATRGATNWTAVAIYDFVVPRRRLSLTFRNIDILCNEEWSEFLLIFEGHYMKYMIILNSRSQFLWHKMREKEEETYWAKDWFASGGVE